MTIDPSPARAHDPGDDPGERSPVLPRDNAQVAGFRAFQRFERGLATGDWSGFVALLSDDFSFQFPAGKWRGRFQGKEKAREFFEYVAAVFPKGLRLTLDRAHYGETTCVFEFHDWGEMVLPGQEPRPYKNLVAISIDLRGEEVVSYREYFGSDGQP